MTAAEEDQATVPGRGAANDASVASTSPGQGDAQPAEAPSPPANDTEAPAANEAVPLTPPGPPVGWLAPIESTAGTPGGPGTVRTTASRWMERTTHAAQRSGDRLAARAAASSQKVTPAARRLTERLAPLTRRAARIDLLALAGHIALIAGGGLVIAAAARAQIDVGLLSAPLWLFAGAALLTGATLGAIRGFLATGLYLGLGLLGAAFDPEGAGAHLDGGWAGVLLALPVAAGLTGAICSAHATLRSPVTSRWYFFGWFFFGALTGMATIYAAGLGVLSLRLDVEGWDLFVTMSARFPFDVAQCILVAIAAVVIHRVAPALLRRGRRWSRPERLGTRVSADHLVNA